MKFYRLWQIFMRGPHKGMILQNFVCKYFGASEIWVIEGSVYKQKAHIVIRHAVKFIPNRRTLWKDAMASLGTSAFHWFHVNWIESGPGETLKLQAGLSTSTWLESATNLTTIQRKVDETMNGWAGFDESCYPDFQINLQERVSYIPLSFSIVHLAEMMKRNWETLE